MDEKSANKRTWSEEIEIAASDLVERVKELIHEGNVRRIIIRNQQGQTLIIIPLTAGVVAGGVLTFFSPMLAAVGAMAALLARVRVEIVRVDDGPDL